MTTATRTRLALFSGLVLFLVLTGTGVAQALWSASTTHTTTATAGKITTTMEGPGLSVGNISTSAWSPPTTVKLNNTSAVDIKAKLAFATTGALAPQRVELALWHLTGAGLSCPTSIITAPSGSAISTLAAPILPTGTETITSNKSLVLCASTRVNGNLFGTAGQTLTATPITTATHTTSNWTATATGAAFTYAMASAPDPVSSITCQVVIPGHVRLSWPAVAGAAKYQVAASRTTREITTTSVDLTILDTSITGRQSVQLTAIGPTGSSAAVTARLWLNGTSPCI